MFLYIIFCCFPDFKGVAFLGSESPEPDFSPSKGIMKFIELQTIIQ